MFPRAFGVRNNFPALGEVAALLARLQARLQGELPGERAHAPMRPPGRLSAPPPEMPPARQAGVLLLLYPRSSVLHFVLTQRANALTRHAGQIALPGGQFEDHDGDIIRTALREASEELGPLPPALRVLGRLSPVYVQPSHFWMTPVLAYTPTPPLFQPASSEVASLIEVPITALLTPQSRCMIQRVLSDGALAEVPAFRFATYEVWGATAMVLNEFATLLHEVL